MHAVESLSESDGACCISHAHRATARCGRDLSPLGAWWLYQVAWVMQLQANPSSEGLCFAQPCNQAESSPKMGSSAISHAWTLFQLCASINAV